MRAALIIPSSAIPMLILTGCADPLGPPFGMGPDGDFVLGVIFLLLFGGFLYRLANRKQGRGEQVTSAARIVQERYARGELTREQYLSMIRDLSVL
jgi:uncharacterized membrane protein